MPVTGGPPRRRGPGPGASDVNGDGTSAAPDLAALVRTEDLVAAPAWTVGDPRRRTGASETAACRQAAARSAPPESGHGARRADRPVRVRCATSTSPDSTVPAHRAGLPAPPTSGRDRGVRRRGAGAALDGEPLGQEPPPIEPAAGLPLAEAVLSSIGRPRRPRPMGADGDLGPDPACSEAPIDSTTVRLDLTSVAVPGVAQCCRRRCVPSARA